MVQNKKNTQAQQPTKQAAKSTKQQAGAVQANPAKGTQAKIQEPQAKNKKR